jgi:hypothetical protein
MHCSPQQRQAGFMWDAGSDSISGEGSSSTLGWGWGGTAAAFFLLGTSLPSSCCSCSLGGSGSAPWNRHWIACPTCACAARREGVQHWLVSEFRRDSCAVPRNVRRGELRVLTASANCHERKRGVRSTSQSWEWFLPPCEITMKICSIRVQISGNQVVVHKDMIAKDEEKLMQRLKAQWTYNSGA